MQITSRRASLTEAAVSGSLVSLWYAMPDVVRSRHLRGVLKAVLLLAGGAYGAAAARREQAAGAGRAVDEPPALARIRTLTSTEPVLDAASIADPATVPERSRARVLTRGAVALVGVILSVAGTVALERAVYRWGERRRARGSRGSHTMIGLVSGVVAALIPLAAAQVERRAHVEHRPRPEDDTQPG